MLDSTIRDLQSVLAGIQNRTTLTQDIPTFAAPGALESTGRSLSSKQALKGHYSSELNLDIQKSTLEDRHPISSANLKPFHSQTRRTTARSHAANFTPQADSLTGTAKGAPLVGRFRSQSARTNQTIADRLDYTDDLNPTRSACFKDDYTYTSATGGRVTINMSSSVFDTYLQIVDARTGSVLAYDDDGGTDTNSQLVFNAAAGARYIVRATSYDPFETGNYTITANASTPTPTPNPTPTPRFSSISGYGLVNAAAAVARAINTATFSDVSDLGGNNWGNDIVKAPEVWARGITGAGVTVAVIDSGVDITHSDLRNNIWVNTREIANDGVDNDRNGYVDDVHGWNFGIGQNNNNVMPGTNDAGQSHGTHVAGTIASLNNGVGSTGVAYNAKIMALRLGNVSGNRFTNAGNLAQAIRYAVDNGAKVINMSLGWSDSTELQSALAYAASKNVITVSASGNEYESSPGTPGRYATQYGLVVGAVDRNRNVADFSNGAGSNQQMQYVTAPGVRVYSTVPGNTHDFSDGTSMASPHVAGVVALMLSANPNLTHSQVRQIVTQSAVGLTGNQAFSTARQTLTDPLLNPMQPAPLAPSRRRSRMQSKISLATVMRSPFSKEKSDGLVIA